MAAEWEKGPQAPEWLKDDDSRSDGGEDTPRAAGALPPPSPPPPPPPPPDHACDPTRVVRAGSLKSLDLHNSEVFSEISRDDVEMVGCTLQRAAAAAEPTAAKPSRREPSSDRPFRLHLHPHPHPRLFGDTRPPRSPRHSSAAAEFDGVWRGPAASRQRPWDAQEKEEEGRTQGHPVVRQAEPRCRRHLWERGGIFGRGGSCGAWSVCGWRRGAWEWAVAVRRGSMAWHGHGHVRVCREHCAAPSTPRLPYHPT